MFQVDASGKAAGARRDSVGCDYRRQEVALVL